MFARCSTVFRKSRVNTSILAILFLLPSFQSKSIHTSLQTRTLTSIDTCRKMAEVYDDAPVLVVGATGNVGKQVVKQILERNVPVRAIVRSPDKLPEEITQNPNFTATKASILDLSDEELTTVVKGCSAVVSTLGHTLSFKGMYGAPRMLCRDASKKLCEAIERTGVPGKFILLNTVGVSDPRGDTPRGFFEKRAIGALTVLLPPMKDNIRANHYVSLDMEKENKLVKWVVVRPDSFVEGPVSKYNLHPKLVTSLFAPQKTTIANIGHFIAELATNTETWNKWESQMPIMEDKEQ